MKYLVNITFIADVPDDSLEGKNKNEFIYALNESGTVNFDSQERDDEYNMPVWCTCVDIKREAQVSFASLDDLLKYNTVESYTRR